MSGRGGAAAYIIGMVNALALLVVLLVSAVTIPAFSLSFYAKEYAKNGTYAQVNMEENDLLAVTEHMINYLKGDEEDLNIETTVAGESRLFFSDREIYHMADVEVLISIGLKVRIAAVIVFAATALMLCITRRPLRKVMTAWQCTAGAVIILLAVLAVVGIVNFSAAFTMFHEIFFSNDLWLLDPSVDLLVNIVPLAFFIDIAIVIALIFALGMAAMIIFSIMMKRLGKQSVYMKK